MHQSIVILALASVATAFPFVADMPGVDSSLFRAHCNKPLQQLGGNQAGGAATCPFNSQHQSIHITSRRMAYQAMVRVAIKFLRRGIQYINLRLLELMILEDLVLV